MPLGSIDPARKQQFFRAVELNRPISTRLMDAVLPTADTFAFRLLGEPMKQFEIQTSTNSIQWLVATNITATNPLILLTLPVETNISKRFFRARELP